MKEVQATAVLVALFALRCIVPLLLTMGVCYLLNRLVARWEAEDIRKSGALSLPCWLVKKCDPSDCPAYQQYGVRCWEVRTKAEGALPTACPTCPLYRQAHT